MKFLKRILRLILAIILVPILAALAVLIWLQTTQWGFAREIAQAEAELRFRIVQTAESWIGSNETDGTHQEIIDLYNSHEPLAQGYAVTYEDNWCATFGSAVAIQLELTDIIPTECGCERQIGLWQEMGRWEENDNYLPLPGDYIFYHWDCTEPGDCQDWSDHVGIVVGTLGPFIKVIEGNKDDMVAYRVILRGNWQIRGYGLPDYASK